MTPPDRSAERRGRNHLARRPNRDRNGSFLKRKPTPRLGADDPLRRPNLRWQETND